MSDGSRLFTPGQPEAYFTLPDVKIGIGFHWQRHMPQSFRGALMIAPDNLIINIVPLEEYLASVISSEMNADAPVEFLKAHAIVSRSWLVAMLRREQARTEVPATGCHTRLRHDPEHGCREIARCSPPCSMTTISPHPHFFAGRSDSGSICCDSCLQKKGAWISAIS